MSTNRTLVNDSTTGLSIYQDIPPSFPPGNPVDESTSQVLSNKTLDDTSTFIANTTNPTSLAQFDASSITPGNTITFTLQDISGTLALTSDIPTLPAFPSSSIVGVSDVQTLSNKDLDGDSTFFRNTADPTKRCRLSMANLLASTNAVWSFPQASSGTFVGTTNSQTLTNKTLEDGTTLFYQTGDPTKLARFSFPSIAVGTTVYQFPATTTGTVVTIANTQTLSNKTLQDSTTSFGDDIAPTKLFKFQCSGLTAGSTRTYTAPDFDGTMVATNVTNRVYNSVPAWSGATYVDGQDGWNDLIGTFDQRSGGGANPFTLTQFDVAGRVYEWATTNSAGQISQAYLTYHWPHDYAPNTDTFFHLHLATNVNVTTTTAFQVWAGFAKRDTGVFPALLQLANITYTFLGAADVRKHIVVEIPLSTAGGSATTLDSAGFETDGILQVQVFYQRGSNGDNMGNNNHTFVLSADIHYKSTGRPTKNKVSPFNT